MANVISLATKRKEQTYICKVYPHQVLMCSGREFKAGPAYPVLYISYKILDWPHIEQLIDQMSKSESRVVLHFERNNGHVDIVLVFYVSFLGNELAKKVLRLSPDKYRMTDISAYIYVSGAFYGENFQVFHNGFKRLKYYWLFLDHVKKEKVIQLKRTNLSPRCGTKLHRVQEGIPEFIR